MRFTAVEIGLNDHWFPSTYSERTETDEVRFDLSEVNGDAFNYPKIYANLNRSEVRRLRDALNALLER